MKPNLMVTGLTANINNQVNQLATVTPRPNAPETYMMRGIPTWQGFNSEVFVRDGYCGNDIVYSIIRLIVDKSVVPPWFVYKEVDAFKAKIYKAIMRRPDLVQNWASVKELKEQAFERTDSDQILNRLMTEPNDEDTFADLLASCLTYKLTTGNDFTYGELIEFGKNAGKPNALYSLPSQYMSLLVDIVPFPARKTGYQLYFGRQVTFTKEEVMHDKYTNPNWSVTGAELYGLSPLKAAAKVLERNNQSNNAVISAYANEAPLGIIYPKMGQTGFDAQGSGGDQMKALKGEIASKSGANKRGLLPITSWEMGFTSIGFTPEDMLFIEAQKWDKEQLCAVYPGAHPALLGSADAATLDNMKLYQKDLCLSGAIPLLCSYRDNLNRQLRNYWGYKGTGLFVDFDTSVYSELEANRVEQTTWLSAAWWLTPAQKLEVMNMEADKNVKKEDLEKLYLPTNIQAIDDFQLITPPEPAK